MASAWPRPNQSPAPVRTRLRAPGPGPSVAHGVPRTTAAGMPSVLPLTRSAAAASSSATARAVAVNRRPSASTPSRRSSSTSTPLAPRAKSVCPLRHGRPAVSLSTTPSRVRPVATSSASRSRNASASGSAGSRRTSTRPPVLEASTPAAAITGPATASTTQVRRSPVRRSATVRTVWAAIATDRSCPSAHRPRALETILLDTTRTSPSTSSASLARAAASSRAARSSSLTTSGSPVRARTSRRATVRPP